MSPETPGNLLAHLNAPHAVAIFIKRGRKHADAQLSGNDAQYATAHAALGGDSHPIRPLPGEVVHSAGEHDAQDILDVTVAKCPIPGCGIHATVRQGRPHHCQLAAADVNRAVAQVESEVLFDVLADHVKTAHQVGHRAV